MLKKLLIGIALFVVGQSLIWFQTNGQFIWPWFRRNPILIAIVGGSTISYMFIIATRLIAEYYDGQIWPGRFIAFTLGMISFSFLTSMLLDEGMNVKTIACIILSIGILCIQLFWK
jgi:hypothetical protein